MRRRGSEVVLAKLRKRSVLLSGHPTSIALEPEFWSALDRRASGEGVSLAALLARLDAGRGPRTLASACRVAALAWASETAGVPVRNEVDPC